MLLLLTSFRFYTRKILYTRHLSPVACTPRQVHSHVPSDSYVFVVYSYWTTLPLLRDRPPFRAWLQKWTTPPFPNSCRNQGWHRLTSQSSLAFYTSSFNPNQHDKIHPLPVKACTLCTITTKTIKTRICSVNETVLQSFYNHLSVTV